MSQECLKQKEKQLEERGFNIVIYANHMLRAAYPAMRKVTLEILKNKLFSIQKMSLKCGQTVYDNWL